LASAAPADQYLINVKALVGKIIPGIQVIARLESNII